MINFKSIYMWDNVDNMMQRFQSRIYFIYNTTDLHGSQFCYKKDEYCSLQYFQCIREICYIKKPFRVGYGSKPQFTPSMNFYLN